MEELYQDLRPHSSNDGVTDVHFMMGHGQTAPVASRSSGSFDLHRIGDAVASRDVYSSIYEAYRLCSRL
jgi:N-methyl-L-proline demethylase